MYYYIREAKSLLSNIYTVPEKFHGNCFDMFASLDAVSVSKKIEKKILIIIVQLLNLLFNKWVAVNQKDYTKTFLRN